MPKSIFPTLNDTSDVQKSASTSTRKNGHFDLRKEVGCFPDGESALMLVCARQRYVASKNWGTKRYLNMKHLYELEKSEGNWIGNEKSRGEPSLNLMLEQTIFAKTPWHNHNEHGHATLLLSNSTTVQSWTCACRNRRRPSAPWRCPCYNYAYSQARFLI